MRGLGAPCPDWVLRVTGLWCRELFYRSLPKELPVPVAHENFSYSAIPRGWSSYRSRNPTASQLSESRLFRQALVKQAWEEPGLASPSHEDVWRLCRDGTFDCSWWMARSRLPVSHLELRAGFVRNPANPPRSVKRRDKFVPEEKRGVLLWKHTERVLVVPMLGPPIHIAGTRAIAFKSGGLIGG